MSLSQQQQQQQQQQQAQQQQVVQQQQPVSVYPNTVTRQPTNHSNGSFGTVFIVLAVIVVISAIACFLGRLCNRSMHKPKKGKQGHAAAAVRHNVTSHHKEKDMEFGFEMSRPIRHKERDIEFGFDKRIPSGKPAGNGHGHGNGNGNGNGESGGYKKPYQNGEFKGETRPATFHNGDLRGSA